jgi:hypothetical protein
LVASPDGENLYVTGNSASTLTIFDRDPGTGLLTLGPQLRDNMGGVDGLANPAVVTIAADGGTPAAPRGSSSSRGTRTMGRSPCTRS